MTLSYTYCGLESDANNIYLYLNYSSLSVHMCTQKKSSPLHNIITVQLIHILVTQYTNEFSYLSFLCRTELCVFPSWKAWASEWDKDSLKGRQKHSPYESQIHVMCFLLDVLCGLFSLARLTRDSPSFKDELDVMKFICKDFWTKVFRRQIDNLRTNHQVN